MTEALSEPPMTFTPKRLHPDGRVSDIEPPYEGWGDDMRLDVAEGRERLLAQLPASGVVHNVGSIASYFSDRGMTFAPYRVINPADPETHEVLARYGMVFKNNRNLTGSYTSQGLYNHQHGVILLARPANYDSRQPESSLVHCNAAAYGITEYDVYLEGEDELYRETVQRGFRSRDSELRVQGGLAETAFASLIVGDYRKDLHDAQGVDYVSAKPLRVRGAGLIHPKYRNPGSVDVNVLGAVTLEVLCAHDPGMAPAILEARRTKAGIRAMLARMEAISPGLGAQMMQDAPVGLERFAPFVGKPFLRHALEATGISTKDVLDVSDEAPLSKYFAAARALATDAAQESGPVRERIEVRFDDPVTRLIGEVTDTMSGGVPGNAVNESDKNNRAEQ